LIVRNLIKTKMSICRLLVSLSFFKLTANGLRLGDVADF